MKRKVNFFCCAIGSLVLGICMMGTTRDWFDNNGHFIAQGAEIWSPMLLGIGFPTLMGFFMGLMAQTMGIDERPERWRLIVCTLCGFVPPAASFAWSLSKIW